jgi:transposase-like protein
MTMPTLTERAHDGDVADAPHPDRPQRRRFTPDYKLAVLTEYDRLSADGAKSALLRREGLYSSHIVEWRRAREAGVLQRTGASAGPPSAKPKAAPDAAALARVTRRAERAEAELAKTKAALDIMGKAHALLEMLAESADSDPKPKQ